MGIRSKWRAGHMQDPVAGVFRVSDWYDAQSGNTRLTGVIVADGIPPTPAEVRPGSHRWAGVDELPITVDRANPANFRVEWDQIVVNDWRSVAQQRASEEAARMAATAQPSAPFGDTTPNTSAPFGATPPNPVAGQGLPAGMEATLRRAGIDPSLMRTATTYYTASTMGQEGMQSMLANMFGGQHPAAAFFNGQQPTVVGGAPAPGTPSTAVLTSVHDVTPPAPLPPGISQADLTLNVERPDGTTYPVTTRLGFRSPERRAAIAVIGSQLPVLVDPNDPGRVTIDVARLNLP